MNSYGEALSLFHALLKRNNQRGSLLCHLHMYDPHAIWPNHLWTEIVITVSI